MGFDSTITTTYENKDLMEKINEHNQNRERSDVANAGMNGRDGLSGKPAERTSCYNRPAKLDCLVKKENRNTIKEKLEYLRDI